MLRQEDKEKLERYVSGKSDKEEEDYINSLFQTGEENIYLKYHLEKDWNIEPGDSSVPEVNLDHLLDRVHHLIRKKEIRKKQKPLHKIVHIYMRIAAILLLPLMIAGGFVYTFLAGKDQIKADQIVNSTIYAPLGSRVTFNLPDGSSGMLNSGSRLTYSLPFNQERKVELEGEAWFEVFHDESHPLEITCGSSVVKVLGTRFNMSAYPEESYVEVVLEEGKVEYSNSDASIGVTLAPSERLVFQNGKISRSVTDPAKYNAWTEGKLVFRGDPMAEVARRIERWYNVKIELADESMDRFSFRATFEDDKLEDVLRLLSMTSPIRYHITPTRIRPDGSYEKEKVTISLKTK